MPNLLDRIRAAWKVFRLGPAVVQPFDQGWGIEPAEFSPPEYLEYYARSVGVFACVQLRASALAGLPPRLYQSKDDDREEVERGKLYDLLQKVNPFWTWNRLIKMTETSLCLSGRCFWVMDRGKSGKGPPKEIWWARGDKMRVVPHPDNYIAGYIYDDGGAQIAFAPDEVIYFRYVNPIDEFSGLSPLAAARLSADLGIAGLRSNANMFKQGMQIGGIISPSDPGTQWTKDQTEEFAEMLTRRMSGADKAHRWVVLSRQMKAEPMTMNAKDAEFLGQMRWSLADVCRVYQVPPVLVQDYERAILSNFEEAHKVLWTLCLVPEKQMLESELKEQLLPMFPGEADSIELDTESVTVLQADKAAEWLREKEQIDRGALTINEWRSGEGLTVVAWGDVWWRPGTLKVTEDAEAEVVPSVPAQIPGAGPGARLLPAAQQPPIDVPALPDGAGPADAAERALRILSALRAQADTARKMLYGSPEHEAAWKALDARARRHEPAFAAMARRHFREQAEAVKARLFASPSRGRSWRKDAATVAGEPFDLWEWTQKLAAASEIMYRLVADDAGTETLHDLGSAISFDLHNPAVTEFLTSRAQRFAEQVSETTWGQLRDSLAIGERDGEGIDALARRVDDVMGDRIRSSAEVIARTEVIGASNGGALLAAKQSGSVNAKRWIAALDDRTRETHSSAHGQVVGLDDDFQVGSGSGQAPGQIGVAAEDVQCRCGIGFVYDERFPDYKPAAKPLSEAEFRSARYQVLNEWTNHSDSRGAVLLKAAVSETFGSDGLYRNPRNHLFTKTDVEEMVPVVLEMRRRVVEQLKARGISEIKLYRGVTSPTAIDGLVESWTTDQAVAKRFDGHTVLERRVPIEDVIAGYDLEGWSFGANESEYVVINGATP